VVSLILAWQAGRVVAKTLRAPTSGCAQPVFVRPFLLLFVHDEMDSSGLDPENPDQHRSHERCDENDIHETDQAKLVQLIDHDRGPTSSNGISSARNGRKS